MAYEHGSLDLGIKNPFRLSGALSASRGLIVGVLGFIVLTQVRSYAQLNALHAWISICIGFGLLGYGLGTLTRGLMQTLRFFVGQSAPTSLAYNHASSESSNATTEQDKVAYTAKQLEQMLAGRKNLTFEEPDGLISRLIHSIFPKLTFLPYPIRNMSQRLGNALIQSLVLVFAYVLSSFVFASGLLSESAAVLQSLLGALFLGYLLLIWQHAGRALSIKHMQHLQHMGLGSTLRTLSIALILPCLFVGISYALLSTQTWPMLQSIQAFFVRLGQHNALQTLSLGIQQHVNLSLWLYLVTFFGLLSFALLGCLVLQRARYSQASTLSSELRDNWQTHMHPQDMFIGLDASVLAKRRYKGVPNRVYQKLEGQINEQVGPKNRFIASTLQETQPRLNPSQKTQSLRNLCTMTSAFAQLLLLGASVLVFYYYPLVFPLLDGSLNALHLAANNAILALDHAAVGLAKLGKLLIAMAMLWVFGRLLLRLSQLFSAEVLFESQLIYVCCEGTYAQSKLTQGNALYGSTQSESAVTHSALSPWLIVTHAISSSFVGMGSKHFNQPRHLLELHRDDACLQKITTDLLSYLGFKPQSKNAQRIPANLTSYSAAPQAQDEDVHEHGEHHLDFADENADYIAPLSAFKAEHVQEAKQSAASTQAPTKLDDSTLDKYFDQEHSASSAAQTESLEDEIPFGYVDDAGMLPPLRATRDEPQLDDDIPFGYTPQFNEASPSNVKGADDFPFGKLYADKHR